MAAVTQDEFWAGAKCDAATPPTLLVNTGFSGVVRDAIGEFTLTLDNPIDDLESLAFVSMRIAALPTDNHIAVSRPTDATVKVWLSTVAGVGLDTQFYVRITKVPTKA